MRAQLSHGYPAAAQGTKWTQHLCPLRTGACGLLPRGLALLSSQLALSHLMLSQLQEPLALSQPVTTDKDRDELPATCWTCSTELMPPCRTQGAVSYRNTATGCISANYSRCQKLCRAWVENRKLRPSACFDHCRFKSQQCTCVNIQGFYKCTFTFETCDKGWHRDFFF